MQFDPWTFFIDFLLRYLAQQALLMVIWLPPLAMLLLAVARLHARWSK